MAPSLLAHACTLEEACSHVLDETSVATNQTGDFPLFRLVSPMLQPMVMVWIAQSKSVSLPSGSWFSLPHYYAHLDPALALAYGLVSPLSVTERAPGRRGQRRGTTLAEPVKLRGEHGGGVGFKTLTPEC